MRSIAFILALFIMGLSIIPCADDDVSQEDSISISASHTDHDADVDLCSPFCVCQCCQSHFTTYSSVYYGLLVYPHIIIETSYLDLLTDGFQMSVLQPPKV